MPLIIPLFHSTLFHSLVSGLINCSTTFFTSTCFFITSFTNIIIIKWYICFLSTFFTDDQYLLSGCCLHFTSVTEHFYHFSFSLSISIKHYISLQNKILQTIDKFFVSFSMIIASKKRLSYLV